MKLMLSLTVILMLDETIRCEHPAGFIRNLPSGKSCGIIALLKGYDFRLQWLKVQAAWRIRRHGGYAVTLWMSGGYLNLLNRMLE